MTVFLSDLHLGRGSREATRAAERDAVALLRAHEAEIVDRADGDAESALVLLGDVFDQWIEYRHVVPTYGARLIGLLADWADRGARIVYTVGNRDPWHGGHLAGLGVTVERAGARLRLSGWDSYIAHGDRDLPPAGAAGRTFHRLQPLLRSPAMARLYRMALPGDAGFALARHVAHRFGSDGAPEPDATAALARAARHRLATTDAQLVAHGHVHKPALDAAAGGTYLNPGYWFGDRTFARLAAPAPDGTPAAPALFRWADGRALPL